MTSPIVEEMTRLGDLVDFVDVSLRLVDEQDEDVREDLKSIRTYATTRMGELWAAIEYECCRRMEGDEKAAMFKRIGCNSLIEVFGKAYRRGVKPEKGTP